MKKRTKVTYWIATIWLALGMVSTGIVQLFNAKVEAGFMTQLGYPTYFLMLLAPGRSWEPPLSWSPALRCSRNGHMQAFSLP